MTGRAKEIEIEPMLDLPGAPPVGGAARQPRALLPPATPPLSVTWNAVVHDCPHATASNAAERTLPPLRQRGPEIWSPGKMRGVPKAAGHPLQERTQDCQDEARHRLCHGGAVPSFVVNLQPRARF